MILMLIDYPYEWHKYMIKGKIRTFRADTPKDIVDKAKVINDHVADVGCKPFFHFENEEN